MCLALVGAPSTRSPSGRLVNLTEGGVDPHISRVSAKQVRTSSAQSLAGMGKRDIRPECDNTAQGGKPMTTRHSPMDIEVALGLKGVVSHATQLSEVDGQAGRLVIRGYDIHELAGRVTFEEAAYLLWHGNLPNRQELEACQQQMAAARHLSGPIMDVLRAAARQATGMHALRLGAATLSLDEPQADDLSPESNRRLALRITARMPALVA